MSPPRPPEPADAAANASGLPLPRWVLWLAVPGMIAPLLIFGFILFTERAHDEQRCPFGELSRRTASPNVEVIEESRRCIDDVEERRFVVLRDGERRVLGERRFAPDLFSPDIYSWEIKVSDEGETHVRVAQKGHGEVVFREGSARERAKARAAKAAR